MFKSKALIAAVVIAAIAVFVVYLTLSVFNHDSDERYSGMNTNTHTMTEDDATSHSEVVPEPTESSDQAATEDSTDNTTKAAAVEDTAMAADEAAETEAVSEAASDKAAAATGGETHVVNAQGLQFAPMVTVIQPGDTVSWENMPTHDTQSIEGLIPDGAETWHSQLGENFQHTFTVEGIYIYKCTPHFGTGMGGAIIVGKPTNIEAIKAADVKGAASRLVKKALAEAEKL